MYIDDNMNSDISKVFLNDFHNGKRVDWQHYKNLSLKVGESYRRINSPKSYRIADCGSFLEFKLFDTGEMKLHHANFCKVRLCPMCAWRRSLKIFAQVSKVMDKCNSDYDYRFIFLTLTCKNCSPGELDSQIDFLFSAFNKMTKRKIFKSAVRGYFRCLEITHNWDQCTFHPHFHVILAVNPSYFSDSKIYISQKKWSLLWADCMSLDYLPVVDVRSFDRATGKEVAEVAKYAVKPSDVISPYGDDKMTDFVVETLDRALNGRRLVSFGGVLKDIHRDLNLDDTENGDLINLGDDEIRDDLNFIICRYRWNIGYSNYLYIDN